MRRSSLAFSSSSSSLLSVVKDSIILNQQQQQKQKQKRGATMMMMMLNFTKLTAGTFCGHHQTRSSSSSTTTKLFVKSSRNNGNSNSSSNNNNGSNNNNNSNNNNSWATQTRGRKTRFNGDIVQTPQEKKLNKLEGQRLSKALAALGVASRRGSETIIFDGRVKVNGAKVLEPQFKVNLDVDVIELDDKVVQGGVEYAGEHFYFLVNKPKGYVCSTKTGGILNNNNNGNNRGEKEETGTGGKKALDLLQTWTEQWKKGNPGKLPPRLFTVGRLDVQTTGMLLVTTDGKWSQRVAHPSSGVVKRYVITAPERVTSAQITKMRKGTEVDGVHVTPVLVEAVTGDGGPKNRVAVEVEDGRNREVRRIAESAGVEVKNLKRTRIGGLKMPSELPAGMFCSLKPHQVSYVLEKSLQQIGGKF
jgi:pseudouridine synthase